MTLIASIDIGSNAMRLLVGGVSPAGRITGSENFRESVRLGQEVFSDGTILEETQKRAIAALKHFNQIIAQRGCTRVRVVGTSALREAQNRTQFLSRVLEETGLSIEVIDGEEEARLVHLAVTSSVKLSKGRAVLIDIGGGSVEVTFTKNGDVVFSDSMKMGTVRLLQMLGSKKLKQKDFVMLIRRYVKGIHRRLDLELEPQPVQYCVGTGGNVEALADIVLKQSGTKRASSRIEFQKLSKIVNSLSSLSVEERMERYSLRPDRADVIVPAGLVLVELMKHVGASTLTVPRVGLKDGVLLDLLSSSGNRQRDFNRRQVIAFARALGARYHFDEAHADRVVGHALSLFDQSKNLHGLGGAERLILQVAALLHDIGTIISVNSHHKHSYYLIRQTPFVGLRSKERELVALVARYHRKALPRDDHEEFKGVTEQERQVVRKLAAFLRLAEGLEREHSDSTIKSLRLKVGPSKVVLSILGRGELLMERWAAASRADLFESVFGRTLSVVLGK